ncbi:MAG TPA: glycosyltransferase [Leptolyngbyaceae cyanobacterium M33_DOE_097]|uniref:Glycosyltransferase n=1 Tax=Oscillatoriales cyanobacterium SpSt-418 TaxID=2282169 RepID=A0A7C3PU71_9CYAN|nr:glycosyltransferase [Leptolyngbyaceae cyanobacterium M33_DOE_097]
MVQIAIVAGSYIPEKCGVAHYTQHLRESLSLQNIESVVLTTQQAAQVASDPSVWGVVDDWDVTDLLPLTKAIHQSQAEILHIQHAAGTYRFKRAIFLLPLLLRLTGWQKPIVTTIHEYGWWEWQPKWFPPQLLEICKMWGQQRGWWDREDGFLLTQSNAIIVTNQTAAKALIERLPQQKALVRQVPIGANIPTATDASKAARQAICQRYNWPEASVIFAFFGFLHPVKGLEILFSAFQQVVAVHPEARLLVIGGVESLALPSDQAAQYWQKLEAQITTLDLAEQIKMTGYLEADQTSKHLAGADIGVLPFNHGVTLKSGSLLALMGHALPVVATLAPDLDLELVQHPDVRFIPPRDVEALTKELNYLFENPELRKQLGYAGKTFSQKFSWSTIAQAHENIYSTVLQPVSALSNRSVI